MVLIPYRINLPSFFGREFLGAAPVRGEAHQRFGEHDADDGDHRQQRQGHGKECVGESLGVLFAVVGYSLYQDGDEDRVEDTAQEELVDPVRQGARYSVGVRDDCCPQGGGENHGPEVSRRPRKKGGRRDREH
jgi:hypothetical protein